MGRGEFALLAVLSVLALVCVDGRPTDNFDKELDELFKRLRVLEKERVEQLELTKQIDSGSLGGDSSSKDSHDDDSEQLDDNSNSTDSNSSSSDSQARRQEVVFKANNESDTIDSQNDNSNITESHDALDKELNKLFKRIRVLAHGRVEEQLDDNSNSTDSNSSSSDSQARRKEVVFKANNDSDTIDNQNGTAVVYKTYNNSDTIDSQNDSSNITESQDALDNEKANSTMNKVAARRVQSDLVRALSEVKADKADESDKLVQEAFIEALRAMYKFRSLATVD